MQTYAEFVSEKEAPITVALEERVLNNIRLLHAVMGIVTEAGELMDQLKRVIFYGKELDTVNVDEELGDLKFYLQLACNVRGVTLEEITERNRAKLNKRYEKKFTEKEALNRNLDAEREILELGHLTEVIS